MAEPIDPFEIAARIVDAKADDYRSRAELRRKADGDMSVYGRQLQEAARVIDDIASEIRAEGRARRESARAATAGKGAAQ